MEKFSIRQLRSRSKVLIPDLQRSSVVYKIPCASCPIFLMQALSSPIDKAVAGADLNSSALC